jgi:type II secretory pathway pseudopilin PulG
MREMAMGAARDVIRSGLLTNAQLSELDHVLRGNQPSTQGLVLAWQTEYEVFANLVDALAAGEIPLEGTGLMNWLQRRGAKYLFHPNRTKRDMGMFCGELIDQVTNAYAQIEFTDVDEFVMEKKRAVDTARGLQKFRETNPIGTILYAMLLPSYQAVMKKKCNSQVSHRATILIAALQAFKKSTGRYPATLNALIPDVIPEIPLDPYDGQPMRYNRSKGIVYSVGEDLKDSDGSTDLLPHKNPRNEWQWQTRDFVFDIQEKIEQPDAEVPSEGAP